MNEFQQYVMWIMLGVAVTYIIYLRIQLYINRSIVRAFQTSSIVVPPHRDKLDPKIGLLAVAILILAVSVIATGVFS